MSGFDVFLSHNSKDKPEVLRLGKALQKRGLTVWLDEWELAPGSSWIDELENIVSTCRSSAVCVGESGLGPWEEPEMKALLIRFMKEKQAGKAAPVIPVLLPNAPADVELPVFLQTLTWLDLRDGLKKELLDRLEWGITGVKPDSLVASSSATSPEGGKRKPPAETWQPRPDLKVSIAHLPQPGKHFVGREDELAILDNAWLDPKTNIVEFVAFGGVGKSALVAEWLNRMQADEYRGAARVFGHSFYSQGSREDAQASADSFLDQALRFFGDPDPTEGSPWDKGERLARLVRQQPTLLILDGVEPLQSPETTDDAGQVRDPGLQALIIELAAASSRIRKNSGGVAMSTGGGPNSCESGYGGGGLTVISTRARIKDIEGRENSSVVSHPLDYLSTDAGTALLKQIGVTGSDDELGLAVEEVGGHALSVTLVGKYVCNAEGGDIIRRFEIGLPRVDLVAAKPNEPGKPNENDENPLEMAVTPDVNEIGRTLVPDAGERRNRSHVAKTFSRIMQRYEVWLSGLQDREGDVEVSGRLALEIARLTGLFDRPITAGEFAALVGRVDSGESKVESEPTFNSPLSTINSRASETEVNLAIGRLVEYGLITKVTGSRIRLSVPSWPSEAGSEVVLDAHPLIREFFACQLEVYFADAAREAHLRVYCHLKQSAPWSPNSFGKMIPLYQLFAHGSKAGLHEEALGDVWLRARVRAAGDLSGSSDDAPSLRRRKVIHASEDFSHLLTGLRAVDEAIQYLGLREGDAIGHGTALGVDPIRWAKQAGTVEVSREHRMFDLLWVWTSCARHGIQISSHQHEKVKQEFVSTAEYVFHPENKISPWDLEIQRTSGLPAAEIMRPSFLDSGPLGDDLRTRLLVRYLTDPSVFRRVRSTIRLDVRDEVDLLIALQSALRLRINELALVVEVNPSSNLLIDELTDLATHPLWRWRPRT